jgi:hypothetical protein
LKILITGYTFRTVDNYLPLVAVLQRRGHVVASCFFPHTTVPKNLELRALPFTSLAFRPMGPGHDDLTHAELRATLKKAVDEFAPNVVLLDDILNYPSNAIAALIREMDPTIRVAAFQHGFFQFWGAYRRHFACDLFFAYGARARREFTGALADRVIALGLPKLSRLRQLEISDDDTLLFVAQETPRAEIIGAALRELRAINGRRIRIRPHPEHSAAYASLASDGFELLGADDDVQPQLAACHAVITTGSTAGIEALLLGKPVVSLPSYSATIFRDSPCQALDYTGAAIQRVLDEWPRRKAELEDFLTDVVSPLSFDLEGAADRFEQAIAGGLPASADEALRQLRRARAEDAYNLCSRISALDAEVSARDERVAQLEAALAQERDRSAMLAAELQAANERLRAARYQLADRLNELLRRHTGAHSLVKRVLGRTLER